MTSAPLTPISLVEEFFNVRLSPKALKRFEAVPTLQWIDFAKFYLKRMEDDFAKLYLGDAQQASKIRLYFEPRISELWDRAVQQNYAATPLLGLNPRPAADATPEYTSRALDPLKKHLLFADSVYIRDSFYYCFDAVADSVESSKWNADPNGKHLVEDSIRSIKSWLPVLIQLRELIVSRAIVFMPYYITPSFPYDATSPKLKEQMRKLIVPRDPQMKDPAEAHLDLSADWSQPPMLEKIAAEVDRHDFSTNDALTAWLNSRLLNLDPVFPNKTMSDWATGIHFQEDSEAADVTTDMISIQMLPFGSAKGIGLKDLHKMRKDEEVFSAVKGVVLRCKDYIEENIGPSSSKQVFTDTCKTLLHDELAEYERKSVLKILDENMAAAFLYSVAIGAAFFLAPPAWSILAPAVLTPKVAREIQKRFDPKRRAYSHLQALL